MEVRTRKKILALHGVAQSGPVFAKRISAIVNTLTPLGYDFVFISGPCDITDTPYIIARQEDWKPGDLERSWWETDDGAGTHAGVETAMELWGKALKEHGPFVGALGFSQGGCAAASIAAMLEPCRRDHGLVKKYFPSWHPPLDFLIMFSGNPYRYPSTLTDWLFYPEGGPDNTIATSTLAFYGRKEWGRDWLQKKRQDWFITRCRDVTIQPHPWKHTVPRTQEYADIVRDFVLGVEKKKQGSKRWKSVL